MTNPSLLRWSLVRLAGVAVAALAGTAIFYAAIGSDAHTLPHLTSEDDFKWQIAAVWTGGDAVLAFVFIVLRETWKRRGFDVDTLEQTDQAPDALGTWFIKSLIIYLALVVILFGGGLLVVPVMHLPLAFASGLLSKAGLYAALLIAVILPMNFVRQLWRLWRWPRRKQ